jgi:hypothetical protein
MKKLIAAVMIVSLFGCTSVAKDSVKENKKEVVKEENIPEFAENASAHLTKEGQKVRQTNWAVLQLKKSYNVDRTFGAGVMNIHVKNVRVIELSHMPKEVKDTLFYYTGKSMMVLLEEGYQANSLAEAEEAAAKTNWKIGKKVSYLEINYTVENTSSAEMQFYSMRDVYFNKFHYHVPSQNFIMSDDTLMGTTDVSRTDYQPGETRNGTIGLLLGEEPSSIPYIEFKTDQLLDGESHEQILAAQTFRINLES